MLVRVLNSQVSVRLSHITSFCAMGINYLIITDFSFLIVILKLLKMAVIDVIINSADETCTCSYYAAESISMLTSAYMH